MIELTLDGQCIETAARNLRSGLQKRLLDADLPEHLARDFELLTEFLTTVDFPRLRATHPTLMGTVFSRVRLRREKDALALIGKKGETFELFTR